jgi:hypothetical protein
MTVAAGLTLLLTGCAHSLVYDENRDKQAQETQKAVTEAHVAPAVATLENTFASVATREEDGAREYEAYLFDLELKTVTRASSLTSKFEPGAADEEIDGLATVLRDRLAELGLLQPGQAEVADETIDRLWRTDSDIAEARDAAQVDFTVFYGTTGHSFESCAEVYAAAEDPQATPRAPSARLLAGLASDIQRRVARIKFPDITASCQKIDAAVAAHEQLYSGGLVAQLSNHVAALKRDIDADDAKIASARIAIDQALEEFKKASPPPGKSALGELQRRATELNDKITGLVEAGGPAVAHLVAEERLAHLEALLQAIAGTPAETPVALKSDDDKVAVAIVRTLPLLKDEADKLFAAADKPRLVPLLAAIDQQKLILKGFEARRRAKQKRLDAAQSQLQAAYREGLAASEVMRPILKHPQWASRSLRDVDASVRGTEKVELYRALGTYADDVQQARIDLAVWEARERAAQFAENLAYSQVAAEQWDSLMDLLAKVLADYHASGIKQADIAEFFKALGLVAVGVGVAQ